MYELGEILEALSSGEITVAQAEKKIWALQKQAERDVAKKIQSYIQDEYGV